ncbi:MAG: 1-deoxy-D-xylulose-5-phosphate synthase [Chloroflexi bacterium]|nr:1-deoxy-D-xylulose-5-phosphate synthase [Chloroflexota bacterium]
MLEISLIPRHEFQRIQKADIKKNERLSLIADMCRANALAAVKRAGSGHLGSSLSAMDIITWLYFAEMNTLELGYDDPNRDIYFSSKGHDVPGLYSLLYAAGVLPEEKLLKLRRFGGLDGHPNVNTPGIEASSGSLGMGISKGRGMAWAKRYRGYGGRVFVMLGDGELQEGQNYEALQSAVHQGISNLTVIVDHNKVQSDKLVREIVDVGDLVQKFRCFGWHATRCDGHDFRQIEQVMKEFAQIDDKPKALVADTLKGRGVSFMEHPRALKEGKGYYRWHSGAPDDSFFLAGHSEIIERIHVRLAANGLAPVQLKAVKPASRAISLVVRNALGEPVSQGGVIKTTTTDEYVVGAYGKALVAAAERRPDLIVLDADLAADCRIREFELSYPDRFIQNGIAEQDMVSMAGGLASAGLLPVVNSFANFLVSRGNEQIYNNASEKTKIIYACHYAGLIPAGPGKSHQSLRDISLLAALPNMTIIQPCNAEETRMVVDYCIDEAEENCAIRLVIGPSPRRIKLPKDYRLQVGRGVTLAEGDDAVLFAYGPVMMHEALLAHELLAEQGCGLRVVNMPWLNRIDTAWLLDAIGGRKTVYVLEDHAPRGGLGDRLREALVGCSEIAGRTFHIFAVEGYPAFGTPWEALQYHALDGVSLARRIRQD